MVYSVTIRGREVTYDDQKDKVYENGNLTYEFKPVFIPNGEDEPSFFGFKDMGNTVYDIYGNQSEITDADKIKL